MKLLYLLKSEPTEATNEMLAAHKETADVTVIDMRENKNYDEIIKQVFAHDKIISC